MTPAAKDQVDYLPRVDYISSETYLYWSMVRPFKMAVPLLFVHLLLDQCLLHSHDYPVLLIISPNQ